MNTSNLDRTYEIDMYTSEIHDLASKFWDAIREVNYDPLDANFDNLDHALKDKLIEFATIMVVPA